MPLEVKMCGFVRQEDALQAARAGVAYCGFIFAPKSKRNLPLNDNTRAWLQSLAHTLQTPPHPPCRLVAVTTSIETKLWQQLADWRVFDILQLSLPQKNLRSISNNDLFSLSTHEGGGFGGLWLSLGMGTLETLVQLPWFRRWPQESRIPLGLILDSLDPHSGYGGSGRRVPAERDTAALLAQARQQAPFVAAWFLAGGLNPENITSTLGQWREAWQGVHRDKNTFPFDGVDLAGGVEDKDHAPYKDPHKINSLMAAISNWR